MKTGDLRDSSAAEGSDRTPEFPTSRGESAGRPKAISGSNPRSRAGTRTRTRPKGGHETPDVAVEVIGSPVPSSAAPAKREPARNGPCLPKRDGHGLVPRNLNPDGTAFRSSSMVPVRSVASRMQGSGRPSGSSRIITSAPPDPRTHPPRGQQHSPGSAAAPPPPCPLASGLPLSVARPPRQRRQSVDQACSVARRADTWPRVAIFSRTAEVKASTGANGKMPDPTRTRQSPAVLLHLREVMRRNALARSTIYALVPSDTTPKPARVGTHAARWIANEIDTWIAKRPRAGTERPNR